MNTCAIQFLKSEKSQYGEPLAAEKIGIEIIASGRGFTWTSMYLSEDESRAQIGIKAEMSYESSLVNRFL